MSSRIHATAEFVRASLELLRAESGERYARVASDLRRAPGRYRVSGEVLTMRVDADNSVVVETGARASGVALTAEATAESIVRLVDGTTTVERLLSEEILVLRGGAEALLALASAVRVFAEGAALSPRQRRSFEEYRSWVDARRGGVSWRAQPRD